MRIDSSASSLFSGLNQAQKKSKTDQNGMLRIGDNKQVEDTTESNLFSSSQAALTEEEQRKLEELKNQLVDLLKDTEDITPEKERRVRQIEKEIEKLTGVKMPKRNLSSMTKMMADMNGKDKDKDQNKAGTIDLEGKAVQEERLRAMQLPKTQTTPGQGIMDFAIAAYQKTMASDLLQGTSFSIKS